MIGTKNKQIIFHLINFLNYYQLLLVQELLVIFEAFVIIIKFNSFISSMKKNIKIHYFFFFLLLSFISFSYFFMLLLRYFCNFGNFALSTVILPSLIFLRRVKGSFFLLKSTVSPALIVGNVKLLPSIFLVSSSILSSLLL